MLSAWLFASMLASHSSASAMASQTPAPTTASARSAAPNERDLTPITHLFQNLAHDLGHMGTRESGEIMLVGSAAALVAHPDDQRVANWARQEQPSSAATAGNRIGTGWVQATGAVATWAIGVASHHRETEALGSDLIRAQMVD